MAGRPVKAGASWKRRALDRAGAEVIHRLREGSPSLTGKIWDFVYDAGSGSYPAPILFIVAEEEPNRIQVNDRALHALAAQDKELRIVPKPSFAGARDALDPVGGRTRNWFARYLSRSG